MNYSIQLNAVNHEGGNAKAASALAFAALTLGDSFKITNIAVLKNSEGKVFVSMPRFKSNDRTEKNEAVYKDICNPITKEFRQELYDDILELYREMEQKGKTDIRKEAADVEEPEFTVKVSPYEREGSNIAGLARVYFEDCFVVGNISILKGKEKEFVAMPSHKAGKTDKQGKPVYQDITYPVTKEFREKLYNAIIDSYQQEKAILAAAGRKQDLTQAQNKYAGKQLESELPFR